MMVRLTCKINKYLLRKYMKDNNITYRYLASMLNVSVSYIYSVINSNKIVSTNTANKILTILLGGVN